jgi:hypothetical protein
MRNRDGGGADPVGGKAWCIIDARDLAAAARLAAESALEHARTAGGARYVLATADGQFFMSRHAEGHVRRASMLTWPSRVASPASLAPSLNCAACGWIACGPAAGEPPGVLRRRPR